ncbi:hypothetical protein D3C80_1560400 [compost metagenome]
MIECLDRPDQRNDACPDTRHVQPEARSDACIAAGDFAAARRIVFKTRIPGDDMRQKHCIDPPVNEMHPPADRMRKTMADP